MAQQEFEGRSVAEASIAACEALGVMRKQLIYTIVSETGEALDKRVVLSVDVEATKTKAQEKPVAAVDELEDDSQSAMNANHEHPDRMQRSDSDRGGRGGRGGRGDGGRGGRGDGRRGGRGDGRRGGRGDGGRGGRGGRGDGRRDSRRRQEPAIDDLLDFDVLPAEGVERRPALAGDVSEHALQAKTTIEEMLKHLEFNIDVQIVEEGDDEIHIDGWGDDAERMIGAKGEALLSLQFLLNRIVGSVEEKTPTIVLDVAGYRQRRKSALSHLAEKLAARACDEHKVVKLTPMSAHDRRVFHMTLKEKDGVSTHSEGTGLYRNLFIVPEDSESANGNSDSPE